MARRTLDVEMRGLDKMQRDLKTFAKKAVPYAVRQTLNDGAFDLRQEWQDQIKRQMTTRNTFTTRSIRVDRAKGLNTRQMVAVTGSVAPYMERQEKGGRITKKGKYGKGIPTAVAAGQGMGTRPIKRLPRAKNRRFTLVKPGGKARNVKARNAAAVRQAASSGGGVVHLQTRRGHGLYRVSGGRKRIKVRMLWDLSRTAVPTPKNPTLAPALRRTNAKMPSIAHKALTKQLKMHRVFGY